MATKKTADDNSVIEIAQIRKQSIKVAIVGERPIIHNRLAEKARQQLLAPSLVVASYERPS